MTLATITLEQVKQLTADGIIAGTEYGALAVGIALMLGVCGRFHFAYSLQYALAAFLTLTLANPDRVGLPLWLGVGIALLLVALFGASVEYGLYRPLARRSGAQALLPVLLASLGLAIAGENAIRLIWGSNPIAIQGFPIEPIEFFGTFFISLDVWKVATLTGLVVAIALMIRLTPLGRAIRATRSNPELARTIGLDPDRVNVVVFLLASLLGGLAGFWYALKFTALPDMGFRSVIYAFVAAFLAGLHRSPIVIFLVGIGIALVEQYTSLWLDTRWSQLAVFSLLIVYLVGRSFDVRTRMRAPRPPAGAQR